MIFTQCGILISISRNEDDRNETSGKKIRDGYSVGSGIS